jgi:hypothetical protein
MKPSFTYRKEYTRPVLFASEASSNILAADSIKISLGDRYNKVSGMHRSLLGENYRNVWATKTSLPVLKLS